MSQTELRITAERTRQRLRLSIREMAQRIGATPEQLQAFEREGATLTPEQVAALADALRTPLPRVQR